MTLEPTHHDIDDAHFARHMRNLGRLTAGAGVALAVLCGWWALRALLVAAGWSQ